MSSTAPFLPLNPLATRLGLPRDWLREQADKGAIPCLMIGRRRFFDLEAVKSSLAARTTQQIREKQGNG
jgi:hypothetical protein